MQLDHSTAADRIEPTKLRSIERVYELWDEALGAKDVEAAAALYASDTVLESPLVRHLLRSEQALSMAARSYANSSASCSSARRRRDVAIAAVSSPMARC